MILRNANHLIRYQGWKVLIQSPELLISFYCCYYLEVFIELRACNVLSSHMEESKFVNSEMRRDFIHQERQHAYYLTI